MKRRCLKCENCYTCDGEPVSCDYGVRDGAFAIGETCPKDGRKLRDFKDGKADGWKS